jgi:hypothetical protein
MNRVGRTLLSHAFDLTLAFQLPVSGWRLRYSLKNKMKGVGQECPTHMNSTHTSYAA